MMARLRRYFFSGLLLWIPIWVTLLVIRFILGLLDNSFSMLPHHYQPQTLLGLAVPGVGVVITLLIILLTGALVTNFLGGQLVKFWDGLVGRIPIVRTIYIGVKQTLETLFNPSGQSFRKVLLVEYPRKGLWSIAFQTG